MRSSARRRVPSLPPHSPLRSSPLTLPWPLRHSQALEVDGNFGPLTQQAVELFQIKCGLSTAQPPFHSFHSPFHSPSTALPQPFHS